MKNSTYTPEFNQLITFTEFFPPLCKRIKIQMKDSDISKNEIIGILLVFYSTVYTQSGRRIGITIYTVKTRLRQVISDEAQPDSDRRSPIILYGKYDSITRFLLQGFIKSF